MIPPRFAAALAFALAPSIAALGCLSVHPAAVAGEAGSGPGSASALGQFAITSPGGASGTVAPTSCTSGDRELFLGVDLTDERSGLVVRLVVDPLDGPVVRVYDRDAPFDRTVLFFRDECETFESSLEETGWIVNDVRVRRVTLDLDCENEEGAAISGRAHADHCD